MAEFEGYFQKGPKRGLNHQHFSPFIFYLIKALINWNFHCVWHWIFFNVVLFWSNLIKKLLFNWRGQIYSQGSTIEFFWHCSRIILKRVGNTACAGSRCRGVRQSRERWECEPIGDRDRAPDAEKLRERGPLFSHWQPGHRYAAKTPHSCK